MSTCKNLQPSLQVYHLSIGKIKPNTVQHHCTLWELSHPATAVGAPVRLCPPPPCPPRCGQTSASGRCPWWCTPSCRGTATAPGACFSPATSRTSSRPAAAAARPRAALPPRSPWSPVGPGALASLHFINKRLIPLCVKLHLLQLVCIDFISLKRSLQ